MSDEEAVRDVSRNLPPIPSFQEHERDIKLLWRTCRWLAISIFALAASVTARLLSIGTAVEEVVAVSTTIFQIILLSYGMAFFVPAFLTSLRRLALSVHMMYESLRMGQETVDAMRDLKSDAKPLFKDARHMVDELKPVAEKLTPEVVDRLEGYMKDIRDRVVRDTEPLPAPRRRVPASVEKDGDGAANA